MLLFFLFASSFRSVLSFCIFMCSNDTWYVLKSFLPSYFTFILFFMLIWNLTFILYIHFFHFLRFRYQKLVRLHPLEQKYQIYHAQSLYKVYFAVKFSCFNSHCTWIISHDTWFNMTKQQINENMKRWSLELYNL